MYCRSTKGRGCSRSSSTIKDHSLRPGTCSAIRRGAGLAIAWHTVQAQQPRLMHDGRRRAPSDWLLRCGYLLRARGCIESLLEREGTPQSCERSRLEHVDVYQRDASVFPRGSSRAGLWYACEAWPSPKSCSRARRARPQHALFTSSAPSSRGATTAIARHLSIGYQATMGPPVRPDGPLSDSYAREPRARIQFGPMAQASSPADRARAH